MNDDRFSLGENDEGESMDQSKTDRMMVVLKKADDSFLSSSKVFPRYFRRRCLPNSKFSCSCGPTATLK